MMERGIWQGKSNRVMHASVSTLANLKGTKQQPQRVKFDCIGEKKKNIHHEEKVADAVKAEQKVKKTRLRTYGGKSQRFPH